MELTNDGLTVWYGTEDTPVGDGVMTIGVGPAHPANAVTVRYRTENHRRGTIRARGQSALVAGPRQYFRAVLPPLAAGSWIELLPTVTCAGRQAPAPVERTGDGQRWLRHRATAAPLPAAGPAPAARPRAPRFTAGLDFLGHVSVRLRRPPEDIGVVPQGLRRNFYLGGGTCEGPRLNATIRAEGGDWLLIQRDGVALPSVRATWDTPDGAVLFSDYSGVFDLGPQGYENALADRFPATPPLRLAPRFVTSDTRYRWLNRLQCVGVGQVDMATLQVDYDLYAVTGGQPLVGRDAPGRPHG